MSKSIVNKALADIPLESIMRAAMHIIIGFNRKVLDWMISLYTSVEDMVTPDSTVPETRKSVENVLNNLKNTNSGLPSNLKGLLHPLKEGRRL